MRRHKPREETPHYACSRSTLPFVRLQRHTVHHDFFAADLYWLARDAKDPDRCRNEIVGALLAPVRPGRIHDLARPPARRDADRYPATQLAGLSGRAFRSLGRVPRSIRDGTPEQERDRGDQVRPLEISPRPFTEAARRVELLLGKVEIRRAHCRVRETVVQRGREAGIEIMSPQRLECVAIHRERLGRTLVREGLREITQLQDATEWTEGGSSGRDRSPVERDGIRPLTTPVRDERAKMEHVTRRSPRKRLRPCDDRLGSLGPAI